MYVGSTMFKGFGDRVLNELRLLSPHGTKVCYRLSVHSFCPCCFISRCSPSFHWHSCSMYSKIIISAPPQRMWSTWVGGSILAALNTFNVIIPLPNNICIRHHHFLLFVSNLLCAFSFQTPKQHGLSSSPNAVQVYVDHKKWIRWKWGQTALGRGPLALQPEITTHPLWLFFEVVEKTKEGQ
jgi:hypothetical protein